MKTYFVDAFTSERFKGNPAAVCITEREIDTSTMQSIATEIGFSETAFIKKLGESTYSIRFYTPKTEIALCGHATLASSKILFETTPLQKINFINSENIELKIERREGKIAMKFPVYDTQPIDVLHPMLTALGIHSAVDTRYSPNNKIILIQIENTDTLAALQPDYTALLNTHTTINGVLVTARSSTRDFDFHYRYFWPWAGTNEDPVTGGVQTFLTKYWSQILQKTVLRSFQSSQRTGTMTTELSENSVILCGEAVTVFEGVLKD